MRLRGPRRALLPFHSSNPFLDHFPIRSPLLSPSFPSTQNTFNLRGSATFCPAFPIRRIQLISPRVCNEFRISSDCTGDTRGPETGSQSSGAYIQNGLIDPKQLRITANVSTIETLNSSRWCSRLTARSKHGQLKIARRRSSGNSDRSTICHRVRLGKAERISTALCHRPRFLGTCINVKLVHMRHGIRSLYKGRRRGGKRDVEYWC